MATAGGPIGLMDTPHQCPPSYTEAWSTRARAEMACLATCSPLSKPQGGTGFECKHTRAVQRCAQDLHRDLQAPPDLWPNESGKHTSAVQRSMLRICSAIS